MKTVKKILAYLLALCVSIGLMPISNAIVHAAETSVLTFSGSAANDSNTRYHIYLDVEGTTASDTLPEESNASLYWNNNTIYVDGEAVSGTGVNYGVSVNANTNKKQLILYLQYSCVDQRATKGADVGTHMINIPAGTTIGALTTQNDITLKIKGASVSKVHGATLERYEGVSQDAASRYIIRFSLSGIDALPDDISSYWSGNKILIDGVETEVNFGDTYDGVAGVTLAAYISYDVIEPGVTSAANMGKHLFEIPAGTFIGSIAITETIRFVTANWYVFDAVETQLQTPAGAQDCWNGEAYSVRVHTGVLPDERTLVGDRVYIDGELVEGVTFGPVGSELRMILPLDKIPNEPATDPGYVGKHTVSIPAGSLIGNLYLTKNAVFQVDNWYVSKVNSLNLQLQDVGLAEADARYNLTFSLGSATANADENDYWSNNTIYVDSEAKTEGVNWLPYADSNTLVLYLQYNTVQPGASSYADVTGSHIVTLPKGSMVGDIYIEEDLILEINGATVTQLDRDPNDTEVLNVGAVNDWRNSQENRTGIYFGTTVADPLATTNAEWTDRYVLHEGGIYYNEQLLPNASLIKILGSLYYIALDGSNITWKPGDTIVVDGWVKEGYELVTFDIGFIRNRDGSFSQYDADAATESQIVQLEDVYVDVETDYYTIPNTPLITNGYVEVKVDGSTTTDYNLTQFGEYEVERIVEDTVHKQAVSGITTTTYKQDVVLYKLGDANGDSDNSNSNNLCDLVSLKKQADIDSYTVSKQAQGGADMNFDNDVTSEDSAIMREYLLGTVTLDEVRETYDDEVVVGVISDMHYADDNSDAQRRINTIKALNYYKSNKTDIIYMNGDVSDYGGHLSYENLVKDITAVFPDEETRPTFIMTADNHEYFEAWYHGSFVPTATFGELQQRFCESLMAIRGSETGMNCQYEMKGYHFIGISSDDMDGGIALYDESTKQYLRDALAQAAAADPNKPIFVAIHQPPNGTVINSNTPGLNEILEQYPQAIVFTSHTHCSLEEETSIWRGKYTVVNTASLYYLADYYDFEIGHRFAQGLLVRINNNTVDIQRYDFWNDKQIKENWFIPAP